MMTETKPEKPRSVRYVLTAGVNLPNDERPRIERGQIVYVKDFPSKKSFELHIDTGLIVDADSTEGKAAIADAPKEVK